MNTTYHKGLRRVSVYYFTGILISLIFHFMWGWKNMNLMPRSASVFIFIVLVGFLWAVLSITGLFSASRRLQSLGELLIHSIIFIAAGIFAIAVQMGE